jgi:putative endonuclease
MAPTVTDKRFHVYILASKSAMLYTGLTNDLVRRVWQHKQKQVPGFARNYGITKLVWFEEHGRATSAMPERGKSRLGGALRKSR